MGRITIRVPDELLDRIDNNRDDDEGRSKWFRDAARAELNRDDRDELRSEIEELKQEVNAVQEHINQPLWKRLLNRDDVQPMSRENTEVEVTKRELTEEERREAEKHLE